MTDKRKEMCVNRGGKKFHPQREKTVQQINKEEECKDRTNDGAGDRWRLLAKLIVSVWHTGTILYHMAWIIVVLIPKGGGNYRGIGHLKPFWKLIKAIINQRLTIVLHDSLHGYKK